MSTLTLRLMMATLIIFGVACAIRLSGTPRVWQLRGVVVSMQNTALVVRHKTGQVVRLTVDEQTVWLRNETLASAESVYPGRRVTIDVESGISAPRARRVHTFGGKTRETRR